MNEQTLQEIVNTVRAVCSHAGAAPEEVREVRFLLAGGEGTLRPAGVQLAGGDEEAPRLEVEVQGAPLPPKQAASRALGKAVGRSVLEALGLADLPIKEVSLRFPASGVVEAHVVRFVTREETAKIVSGPLAVLGREYQEFFRGKVEEAGVAVTLEGAAG